MTYKYTDESDDLVGHVRSCMEFLKKEAQNYNCNFCVFVGEDPLYTSYTRYEASTYEEALSYTKGYRNCMIFQLNQ